MSCYFTTTYISGDICYTHTQLIKRNNKTLGFIKKYFLHFCSPYGFSAASPFLSTQVISMTASTSHIYVVIVWLSLKTTIQGITH